MLNLRKVKPKKVIKREGFLQDFDVNRIVRAVSKAMKATKQYDEKVLEKVVNFVIRVLNEKYDENSYPHVEEIQDIIEIALMKYNLYDVAKAFITYRRERAKIREEKKKLLNKEKLDEVDKKFSLNSLRVLASRYLIRDEKGNIIESPKQLFQRVALLMVIPEIVYDKRVFDLQSMQEEIDDKWDLEKLKKIEGKVFIKGVNGKGEEEKLFFNVWHLERFYHLWDTLNKKHQMKKSFTQIIEMVKNGLFNEVYNTYRKFFELMVNKKFLPNSPTLFNAGTKLGQLSACFVLPIHDSLESIMEAAKEAAIIFKSGGGIGINYSELRPKGDIVHSTGGISSGPVSFMKIIDTVTEVVKQGGKRRGANISILEVWHPDIEEFITAKLSKREFTNMNISVLIDDEFFKALKSKKEYYLINPRNREVVRAVNPKDIFKLIASSAWESAEPGVLFLSNINKRNPLKDSFGLIRATNPCGEIPLYPYESCNLGSINLYAFIKEKDGKKYFDWKEYIETIRWAYKFLDNLIDVNKFPFDKVEFVTKASRKIGLGIMGLAEALIALDIPYNSEKGFKLMRKFAEYLTYYAMEESVKRAIERGKFELYDKSFYSKGEMPVEGFYHKEEWTLDWDKLREKIVKYGLRNVSVTTIAPTGSLSMIADTSSGVEPIYSLVFEKRVTVGTFFYVDEELKKRLEDLNLYDDELIKEIAENKGSLQGIKGVPAKLKRIFLTAYDIPYWDHIRAQAEMQKWITNSISKTINMPSFVKPEDVEKAYLLAYKLGLKGITVYREGSLESQVLVSKGKRRAGFVITKNETLNIAKKLGIDIEIREEIPFVKIETMEKEESKEVVKEVGIEKCPVCGSTNLAYKEGCITCLSCGWSLCSVS